MDSFGLLRAGTVHLWLLQTILAKCVFLTVYGCWISSLLHLQSLGGLTKVSVKCLYFRRRKTKNTVFLISLTEFLGSSWGHDSETIMWNGQPQCQPSVVKGSDQHTPRFWHQEATLRMWAAKHLATCHGAGGWRMVGSTWNTEIH